MKKDNSISTVCITGGGSGIGLAAAKLFYESGYRVLLLGRTAEKINTAVNSLKKNADDDRIQGYTVDVSDEKAVKSLFHTLEDPGVDILVNNAGIITPIARITESVPQEWLDTLKINIFGVYLCSREVIPGMLKRGHGTIINISSGSAHRPLEGWSAYASSKAGLYLFTASIHEEYGASGIRVFGYRPGMVDTPMQEVIRQSGVNRISQVKREELLAPEYSARVILYLAQGGDEYCGQEVDVKDSELLSRLSFDKALNKKNKNNG